ncbi:MULTISPECIES: GNAT family N-acetyltransferase [Streptomyces]|uniref:GCN5 family acetyltransferase n=2 Tax=Streptomyces TaxID=1883 RepID=A0A100YA33_9ACTN|nr:MULTISPECIES: GNAT family N-acetyltransferase [Streptomyces]KUH40577.1 GCN5 family acetyltransferase [Streptomyces kanasensis]UUS33645.1 GNAT family N-acetyltransferase [Streptomyces changanensis]
MRIRPARHADLPRLQDVERAAGEPFRALGMDAVADDDPPPLTTLEEYRAAGRALVAEEGGPALAYLLWDDVDGAAHVEQVSVHPDAARRGLGRALIEELAADTAARGVPALTLTTFRDVPWNAPYYARIGFRVLAAAELTHGLRGIRHAEAAHGLDRWPRVCMRRDLPRAPGR